mgnify:CR=1 FL=1
MWILREEMRDDEGENLLVSVADVWNYFFRELLPSLQVIMLDVPPVSTPSKYCRQVLLVSTTSKYRQ